MNGRWEHRQGDVELLGLVLGVAESSVLGWVVAGVILLTARLLRRRSRSAGARRADDPATRRGMPGA